MKDNVRFMYLRDRKGIPVACVAYRQRDEVGSIDFAVSVHNPLDRWDRQRGRSIAEARLLKGPVGIKVRPEAACNNHAIMAAIADAIRTFGDFPTRARKAAATWFNADSIPVDMTVTNLPANQEVPGYTATVIAPPRAVEFGNVVNILNTK